MSQPTLGLLEELRPPLGYRTEAAFGTTYSADLLTCMAVLTTLDGGDGEELCYGRVEAYRALDHLRNKVVICYQAGRVMHRDGEKYPSLALLDQILVPIRLERQRSFHPKVWLVRQIDQEGRERYVLIVSSRNITTSTDWDLGIVIEGTLNGAGISLPPLRIFAEHSLGLAGVPSRLDALGRLDEVKWKLPRHVKEFSFGFQAGTNGARELHSEWDTFNAAPSHLLILSPFIDSLMINEASMRWRTVPDRRLVAGPEDLKSIALGPAREALRALRPRRMVASEEDPRPLVGESAEAALEEMEPTRSLHAKIIAFKDAQRATLIIGSNNLTSSGWRGGNTEAFVQLVGDPQLFDPLWDWAYDRAELFEFPTPETALPKKPLFDQVKDELHSIHFRLEEPGGEAPSRVVLINPQALQLPDGIQLTVARYTTPLDAVAFPNGESSINIFGCRTALRTRFVVCKLSDSDNETAWITAAELDPPLSDERDRERIAELLGFRQFLALLQALNSDDFIQGTPEGDRDDDRSQDKPPSFQAALVEDVTLENLLKQLVVNQLAFAEMNHAVLRYGALMKKDQLDPEDGDLLDKFREAWGAIQQAFEQ